MNRVAVLSDVNGNLEALDAVLEDIKFQNVDKVHFLGDAIGYGPDPEKCLARLQAEADCYLLGRIEHALLTRKDLINDPMITYCKEELRHKYMAVTKRIPDTFEEDGVTYIHGNPRGREHKTLLFELGITEEEFTKIAPLFDRTLVIGDNHQPWYFSMSDGIVPAKECNYRTKFSSDKAIVSVGSVGQPRDGDPRACYGILTSIDIEWRRVDYDIQTTVDKIAKLVGDRSYFWERLLDGR